MAVPRPEVERRVARFAEACRRAGMRGTHQRMEVFREVAASDEHPDAETIYERVRQRVTGLSRDTIYRTLAALEDQRLIRRAGGLGGPIRYDANLGRHHHFVCIACGLVKDFRSEALDRLPIPKAVQSWGRIEAAQVQVRGICESCAGKSGKEDSPCTLRPRGRKGRGHD